MKNKLEQLSQAYKKAIGQILLELFPGTLPLSVNDALIDPSLQHGKVWLVTTPAILTNVIAKRPEIQAALKDKIKGRFTPKLEFVLDDDYLGNIDQLFDQVERP